MKDLVKNALSGDRRAIGRLISLAENGGKDAAALMREIQKRAKGAPVVGVTGVAGSGKSTLISFLAAEFRKRGKKVGIIAIDPTSPFSGGAFLGDRVRMAAVAMDEGVFIRSMGTRGTHGGLAPAVCDAAKILDACGFDLIIVETVGIGQDEVEVAKIADVTTVIVVPGLGDWVQTIKAGIMEIGDIFVINKSDLNGADETEMELKSMQELGGERSKNPAPILKTIALRGEGVDLLAAEVLRCLSAAL